MADKMVRMYATYDVLPSPLKDGLPPNGVSVDEPDVILCQSKPFPKDSGFKTDEPWPTLIVEFEAPLSDLWIDWDDDPDTIPEEYTHDTASKYEDVFDSVEQLEEYLANNNVMMYGTYVNEVPLNRIVAIYPAIWDMEGTGKLYINRGGKIDAL